MPTTRDNPISLDALFHGGRFESEVFGPFQLEHVHVADLQVAEDELAAFDGLNPTDDQYACFRFDGWIAGGAYPVSAVTFDSKYRKEIIGCLVEFAETEPVSWRTVGGVGCLEVDGDAPVFGLQCASGCFGIGDAQFVKQNVNEDHDDFVDEIVQRMIAKGATAFDGFVGPKEASPYLVLDADETTVEFVSGIDGKHRKVCLYADFNREGITIDRPRLAITSTEASA